MTFRRCRSWAPAAVLVATLAGCGGPPPSLDRAAVADLFKGLHEPVYRVYELGLDRDAIHDHLASSFSGRLLTDQYVEHYTTLVRMGREQTAIRVVRVDYEEIEVAEPEPGVVQVVADWSVGGVVSHQEHKHLRTNRYRALYELAETADGWRIVTARLRDLRRVKTGLGLSDDLPESAGGMMSPLELLRAGVGEDLPDGDGDGAEAPAE
ncbi:MAG: hypothetical protein AAGM22_02615 [Acidobacteriota bacterium]